MHMYIYIYICIVINGLVNFNIITLIKSKIVLLKYKLLFNCN